jgi:hypothetical protein
MCRTELHASLIRKILLGFNPQIPIKKRRTQNGNREEKEGWEGKSVQEREMEYTTSILYKLVEKRTD